MDLAGLIAHAVRDSRTSRGVWWPVLAWIAGGAIAWVTMGAAVAMIVGGVIGRCQSQVRRPATVPAPASVSVAPASVGAVHLPTQRSSSPRCGCRAVVGRGVAGGRAG